MFRDGTGRMDSQRQGAGGEQRAYGNTPLPADSATTRPPALMEPVFEREIVERRCDNDKYGYVQQQKEHNE